MSGFQYRLENLSLSLQQGVRRSILIYIAICVVLLTPVFFLGQFLSSAWFKTPINPWRLDNSQVFVSKETSIADLEIGRSQVVSLDGGEQALYLTVSNKGNSTIGFNPWVYKLQILDKDEVLLSEQEFQGYLLPEEVKFLVASFPDDRATSMRFVQTQDTKKIDYNPLSGPQNPDVQILSQSFEEMDNGKLRLFAQFRNNDQANIEKIDILYIVRDTRQSVVGIGTFSFNGFKSGTTREMVVEYPMPEDRVPRILDVRWSVNYLDSNQFSF